MMETCLLQNKLNLPLVVSALYNPGIFASFHGDGIYLNQDNVEQSLCSIVRPFTYHKKTLNKVSLMEETLGSYTIYPDAMQLHFILLICFPCLCLCRMRSLSVTLLLLLALALIPEASMKGKNKESEFLHDSSLNSGMSQWFQKAALFQKITNHMIQQIRVSLRDFI